MVDDVVELTPQQAANLKRFNKRLPAGNTGTKIDRVGDEVLFTADVPGRIPGSKKVYQKSVDANGNTTILLKTTIDPQGNIPHIKDGLHGDTIIHSDLK